MQLTTQQNSNAMNAGLALQINHLNLSRASVRIGGRYWSNVKTTNPTHPNPPTALQTAYHCARHVKTSLRQEMNS